MSDGDAIARTARHTALEFPQSMHATPESPTTKPSLTFALNQSDRPLPWLSWRYSLLFLAALIGIAATTAWFAYLKPESGPQELVFRVVDASNAPVAGAVVRVGDLEQVTDNDGVARLPGTDTTQPITVERDGFVGQQGSIDPADGSRREITLQSSTTEPSASRDTPVTPPVTNAATAIATPSTPEDTTLVPPIGSPAASTEGLSANEIAGKVLDTAGKPIQGARVVSGEVWSVTGADGIYRLDRAKVDDAKPLRAFASGYQDKDVEVPAAGSSLDITLDEFMVKAIYLNPGITNTPAKVQALIDIANTTEINAIVIDIKEELVFYDTQVQLFRDAGTVNPILDIDALLQQMQDNGIYTIARLVVFKDSLVAEKRHDLAIKSTVTGDAWRDMNEVAWVNPTEHELWEANTQLSVEAANLGFDEIQFDYVRFPTDGDLSTMDLDLTQATRENAINGFVDYAYQRLIPTGAKLSADVFGYTLLVQDDLGIGQNLRTLEPHLDFLSPMVYPSHYGENFQGYIPPNDYPGEVVGISMQSGVDLLGLTPKKLRPWLQDFDYFGDVKPYNAPEVRAQIDATEEVGASGWMLWSPDNVYQVDALLPEPSASGGKTADLAALVALAGVAAAPARASGVPLRHQASVSA
ncbi:MAG: putative glycoside hydrolase [Thermomicrobiales bacterium]